MNTVNAFSVSSIVAPRTSRSNPSTWASLGGRLCDLCPCLCEMHLTHRTAYPSEEAWATETLTDAVTSLSTTTCLLGAYWCKQRNLSCLVASVYPQHFMAQKPPNHCTTHSGMHVVCITTQVCMWCGSCLIMCVCVCVETTQPLHNPLRYACGVHHNSGMHVVWIMSDHVCVCVCVCVVWRGCHNHVPVALKHRAGFFVDYA